MAIRSRAFRAQLLCSVPLILICAGPVAAQESDGFFQMLGRIILGAGTAKVAIETPQAVTTIEEAELERDQPATLSDLFKAVPGVQGAGASARVLGQAFNIRGIGNSEQTASEARIIVTVDGAPKFYESYRMGSFFGDLDLYKRVEVLRGPASSTLYGSGAIGGAVNFTTKDASDYLEEGERQAFRFSSGYESNGEGVKLGILSATRVGTAEFLAALNTTSSNDKADGSGTRLAGTAYEGWSGLLKGKWAFGAEGEQSLTFSVARTDSDLDDTPVAQTGGATVTSFGLHDLHSVDDTITLTWRNEFRDNPLLDLTVQASYTDTSVEKDDYSLGALCSVGTFQVLCDSSYGYATTTLKVENTADLSAGGWENYLTFGVQVMDQERTATSTLGALGFHPGGTDSRIGAYVQGEFTFAERFTIIPGVRVDFGEQVPNAASAAAGGTAQEERAVSPKIAAMYEVTDRFALFGSVARTERMPTLDELYSTQAAGALPARTVSLGLETESADTVELGFTLQRDNLLSEGDNLQIKVTAFHNDVTNMIAVTPRVAGGPAVPYFSNIAAAELWGGEIEAAYEAERWFAQLAYAHVRSKDGTTGLTLADTPAETVVLTLGAKLPEQALTLGWRASYFDDITTSSATTSAPSYDTHDLFLTWAPEEGALAGLEVNLSVENVFDATYRNNLSLDNAVGRTAKLSIAKRIAF